MSETYESDFSDASGFAVLFAFHFFSDHSGRLLWLTVFWFLLVLLLPFLNEPQSSLVEHATSGQTHNSAALQLGVDRVGARFLFLFSLGHFVAFFF